MLKTTLYGIVLKFMIFNIFVVLMSNWKKTCNEVDFTN